MFQRVFDSNPFCSAPVGFARYCLAVGTSVAKFDGTHVPVEDLRVGDLLVSQDREPTTITAIYKDVSPSMIKITYMDGSHVVTPNHLVTLRWGGNPHVQPVVVGTSWSLLRIDWYDRDTLAKKEQYFRYVLPEQPLPNRSNGEATVFDTVDDAIDAAIFDGDKLIYEGVWERGTMTDAVIPVHKSDTLTLTMSKGTGSDRTYKYLHYVVRNATRKTFSEKLPHGLTLKQLKQFGYWWIQLAERTGNARPLHLGDLIDVRADHLERLRQDPKFAEAVSIPMVNVARVFKTGPSGRELPGPVSAPLAGARPSRWDVMPDGMSSAAPSRSLAPSPGVFASTGLPCAGVPAVSDQEERPTDEADPEELPSVDALVATFLSETHQSLTPVSVASGSTPATMEYPRKVVLTELQHRDRAQRQADKAAGKPVAKGPGSKLNIEAEKSSGGTDMACGVTSVAHIAIAPAAVAEAQAIGRAAPEFTQYVIKPMDDSGEMFGYRPLAVGDNINVLYMVRQTCNKPSSLECSDR